MKRKRKPLPSNSLEHRNMARHAMPPPTSRHKDRKKVARKEACRKPLNLNH